MFGHKDLLGLARRLDVDLPASPEERVRDILGRISLGDIEGLAAAAGISRKKAARVVHAFNETRAGVKERKALPTVDARRLKQDILAFFAAEASSKIGKNVISTLTPALDREAIGTRLETYRTGRGIFDDLKGEGRLDEVREILRKIDAKPAAGKATEPKGSETIQFFASRASLMAAAQSLMERHGGVRALASFFGEIDGEGVGEIIKILEEIEGLEIRDADAMVADAEILINDELRRERVDEERARRVVEDHIAEIVATLKMDWKEETDLRKVALERLAVPFEFDRIGVKRVVERWRKRQAEEQAARLAQIDTRLKGLWDLAERTVERLILLDQMLAVASMMERYALVIPTIGSEGTGFIDGQNLFLLKERAEGKISEVQPVSFNLGKTRTIEVAPPQNVSMLTGANSGGKTTLLTTLATIHILTLLGLPVPCRKAEVTPMPIYLFRRRMTKKIGSLEHALSSLIPVFADRQRKLVLMDEFEALTEPGAAGRIIAAIVNRSAASSSLVLLVTHLARETLPHVRLPIRVDGIEAEGLDERGELVADRQPKFGHIGSSTPRFIVKKLAKAARKKRVKALYEDVLRTLEGEAAASFQAPLNLPWIGEEPAGE